LIIGPNNRRFEKFVQVKENGSKFAINKVNHKDQGITEAFYFLREAINTAIRENPELAEPVETEDLDAVEEDVTEGEESTTEPTVTATTAAPATETAAPAATAAPAK